MKTRHSLSRRHFLKSACAVGAAIAASGLIPLPVCAASRRTEQQTRLLMGTVVTLTAVTTSPAAAEDAFASAFAETERQIAFFDRRSAASALGTLNSNGGISDAPPELITVLDVALRLGQATGQAFNPAVTPLVDLLASAGGSALPGYANSDLKHALSLAAPGGLRLNGRAVRLERAGMLLTLDGIAKGFIADAASRAIARAGLHDHMVNAGGDIRVSGRNAEGRPWTVGVQHPGNRNELIAAVPVASGGIATSGSYENSYNARQTRHHLVSHLTGRSADVTSVTVRAQNTMEADALATALSLMPPAQALQCAVKARASALIVDRQGRVFKSADWS